MCEKGLEVVASTDLDLTPLPKPLSSYLQSCGEEVWSVVKAVRLGSQALGLDLTPSLTLVAVLLVLCEERGYVKVAQKWASS